MKILLKSFALASFVLVSAFVIGVLANPGRAVAQEAEDQEQTENQDQSDDSEQSQSATYSYTAQPGDSYSKIARKAVQTFGAVKQVSLSQAQIVAAETYLTQAAGSPVLSVGQALTVSESDVDAAIKKAQALTEAQLNLWQHYVAGVDFNTDNVGEVRS